MNVLLLFWLFVAIGIYDADNDEPKMTNNLWMRLSWNLCLFANFLWLTRITFHRNDFLHHSENYGITLIRLLDKQNQYCTYFLCVCSVHSFSISSVNSRLWFHIYSCIITHRPQGQQCQHFLRFQFFFGFVQYIFRQIFTKNHFTDGSEESLMIANLVNLPTKNNDKRNNNRQPCPISDSFIQILEKF